MRCSRPISFVRSITGSRSACSSSDDTTDRRACASTPPRWHPRSRRLGTARTRDVRAAARLRREIASWKPDIVQSHGGDSVKIVAAASVGAKTRVIHRWIGAPSPKITRGVGRVGAAAILSTGSATVAVSDAVRCQILDRFWLPIDRVVDDPERRGPCARAC